jgi:glutathione S-transferase
MSDDIVLYRAIATRAIVPLWMLEELGLTYRSEIVDLRSAVEARPAGLLAVNPSGRTPLLIDGGVAISEMPAICIYLADRYGYGTLAPRIEDPRRGPYLKWLVYATAVLEPARETQASTIVRPKNGYGVGWPPLATVVHELVQALDGRDYILGDAFTAADVMLGSMVGISLFCELIPPEPALVRYAERVEARPARARAGALNWPPELFAPREG